MESIILSDRDQIRQAVQLMLGPVWERDDVTELRALGTKEVTVSRGWPSETPLATQASS